MPLFTIITTPLQVIRELCFPWVMMGLAALHAPKAIYDSIRDRQWSNFGGLYNFSDAIFATLWTTIGPIIKNVARKPTQSLLEGRIHKGKIVDQPAYPPIHGVVMEIGAGSGMWADVLAQIRDAQALGTSTAVAGTSAKESKITKIYGVEPNTKSNKALQTRVSDVGLADVYEVVPVGIEQVTDKSKWSGDIAPGSIDCIITQSCLCSIPEPEKNIKLLYNLLKPGGWWYMSEHVMVERQRGGLLIGLYQRKSFPRLVFSFFSLHSVC